MTEIAISSFSLRQQLGPVRIGYVDAAGQDAEFVLEYPTLLTLPQFVHRSRREFGTSAIEICQIQWPTDRGDADAKLEAALVEASVSLLTVPIDIGDLASPDPERRARDLVETELWIARSAALGARFVRVNAGAPIGDVEFDLGALDESLRRLSDFCSTRSVRLLIENHGGRSSSAGFLIDLVDRVGRDRIGILLDLGNFEPMLTVAGAAMTGAPVDPAELDFEPLFTAVGALAPYAEVIHAKSYGFDERGDHQPFDLGRALEIVQRSGFTGPITVEYEGADGDPWLQTGKTVELVREVFGR